MEKLIKPGYPVLIKIIKSPDFPAPAYVHEAWLNVEFPGRGGIYIAQGEATQLITNIPLPTFNDAYAIDQLVVLLALKKINPQTYTWWHDNRFPKFGYFFIFKKEECVECPI